MTKQKLIEALSDELNITKKQADHFLDKFAKIVSNALKDGEKVALTGFGTFDLGKRKARKGIDPQTKKSIKIPSMNMPRFRAGKRLKEIVRQ